MVLYLLPLLHELMAHLKQKVNTNQLKIRYVRSMNFKNMDNI